MPSGDFVIFNWRPCYMGHVGSRDSRGRCTACEKEQAEYRKKKKKKIGVDTVQTKVGAMRVNIKRSTI